MERPTVLLALLDAQTEHAEALRRAGFEPATEIEEIGQTIARAGIDLAVIDCELPSDIVRATYGALHAGGSVPTILLVDADSAGIPEGMTVDGATDEVAIKPVPPEALVFRLQALLIRSGRSLPVESGAWASAETLNQAPLAGEGHVVSVFAPKGGVGKTTIAVNMAVALREQTRSDVLLFDADVGVGNVTSVLDVPYRFGLSDLADEAPEHWTDAAFEQAVAVHAASGVRVLTWGHDPGQSERVTVDLLLAALRWARNHHQYVIVDNHPGYDDRVMAMLTLANEIFLIVTPEVGAIRNSAQFLELARQVGLGNVVRVIVNRANHGIRLADLSKSLGLPIAATVVSSGPKAVIASNEGKPIITKFPRDQISDDLHRVARLVSQPEPQAAAPAPAKPWWLRVGARISNA